METAEMIRLYESGKTLQQVAKAAGVSVSTVQWNLAGAGIKRRAPGARRSLDRQEAYRLYLAGWPMRQIADRFGVTKAAVSLAFKMEGLNAKGGRDIVLTARPMIAADLGL